MVLSGSFPSDVDSSLLVASNVAGSWRMMGKMGTLTAVSSSCKAAVDQGMVAFEVAVDPFEMVVDPLDMAEGSWDTSATLGKAGSPGTAGIAASFEASRSME